MLPRDWGQIDPDAQCTFWARPVFREGVKMHNRKKRSGQRKRLAPSVRAQVIIAALGAVSAVAGCVGQIAR